MVDRQLLSWQQPGLTVSPHRFLLDCRLFPSISDISSRDEYLNLMAELVHFSPVAVNCSQLASRNRLLSKPSGMNKKKAVTNKVASRGKERTQVGR